MLCLSFLECHFHIASSGTSANAMVTFKGKSFVLELLNISPYSSWTSGCMALILRVVIHSNQGLSWWLSALKYMVFVDVFNL